MLTNWIPCLKCLNTLFSLLETILSPLLHSSGLSSSIISLVAETWIMCLCYMDSWHLPHSLSLYHTLTIVYMCISSTILSSKRAVRYLACIPRLINISSMYKKASLIITWNSKSLIRIEPKRQINTRRHTHTENTTYSSVDLWWNPIQNTSQLFLYIWRHLTNGVWKSKRKSFGILVRLDVTTTKNLEQKGRGPNLIQ